MKNWQEKKLSELCEYVTVGYVGSMANEYVEKGIPFLRSLNIKPYYLDFNNLMFIDDAFHKKLKKSSLKFGDVAIVRTGYPGTACVIPESLGEANCSDLVIIRPGKQLNSHFLAAIFNSSFGKNLVAGNLVGAAQQHFNVTVAKELKFRFPPKETQDKIAGILSAYDDLIENNKRRIVLLEKMAEELYREWFVRFRFPGWREAEFEKGIPKGWEVRALSDLADINKSNLKHNAAQGFIEYVDIGSVTTNQITETTIYAIADAPGRARRKTNHGDIIWSSVRPANRAYALIFKPPQNLVISTGFAVISPKDHYYYPFLLKATTTDSYVDQITAVAKGAAYPATSFEDFEKSKILTPECQLVKKYYELINPIFEQIFLLGKKNQNLGKTKEALLPRLMSGKLAVEDLAVQLPPSMREATA